MPSVPPRCSHLVRFTSLYRCKTTTMFARRNVRASQFRFDHGRRLYSLFCEVTIRCDMHCFQVSLTTLFGKPKMKEKASHQIHTEQQLETDSVSNCIRHTVGRRLIKCVDCSFSRTSSLHKRVSELTIQPSTDCVYIYTETKTALIVHLGEAADFHVTARLVHICQRFLNRQ